MTVGHWDYDVRHAAPGGYVGGKTHKEWDGEDRPSWKDEPYVRPTMREILRDGEVVRFRAATLPTTRPPRRARDTDHRYYMYYDKSDGEPISFWVDGEEKTDWSSQWFECADSSSFLLDSNDQINLLGKLREKLQGSDFNMSVFLGESHQTVRLIGDTAIKIAKSIHHLRKGDLAGTARALIEGTSRKPHKPYSQMKPFRPTLDNMSRHWLEVQYGWRPLLQDVEGAAQAVAHKLSWPAQQTYRMSVKKKQVDTRTYASIVKPPAAGGPAQCRPRSRYRSTSVG